MAKNLENCLSMSISFPEKQFKGKIVILIFSNDLLQEVMGMLIMEMETMWIGRNTYIHYHNIDS